MRLDPTPPPAVPHVQEKLQRSAAARMDDLLRGLANGP